jgi:hypothetical protein
MQTSLGLLWWVVEPSIAAWMGISSFCFVWYSARRIARWWMMWDTANATYMNFFLFSCGLASYFYANIWKRIRMNVGNQHSHQSCFTRRFLVVTQKGRIEFYFIFRYFKNTYYRLICCYLDKSRQTMGLLENVWNVNFLHASVSACQWGCMYMWVWIMCLFTLATRKWLFVSFHPRCSMNLGQV